MDYKVLAKKMNENSEDKALKKFNYRMANDTVLNINPDDVPTLVPAKIMSIFMAGDESPYYKIQAIEYPCKANGYNYTESFFQSFVKKLNRSYIPGSKDGHTMSYGKRPETDILLVGAKIVQNGSGTGTVYFKNYIPKSGESGDNSFFIKENQANNVDYSLVAYTRDEEIKNPDGSVTYNVLESLFGERNDAVEYGKGAMPQKTNETLPDGNVKNKDRRNSKMEKTEILDSLKTLKENMQISLPEVAKHIGLENLVVTPEHVNALEVIGELKTLCGADPVSFVKSILTEKKENAAKVREAELSAIAGPVIFKENEKKNELREFAEVFFTSKEINEATKTEFKANSIAQKLAGERADWSSPSNTIGFSDKSGTEKQNAIGGTRKL